MQQDPAVKFDGVVEALGLSGFLQAQDPGTHVHNQDVEEATGSRPVGNRARCFEPACAPFCFSTRPRPGRSRCRARRLPCYGTPCTHLRRCGTASAPPSCLNRLGIPDLETKVNNGALVCYVARMHPGRLPHQVVYNRRSAVRLDADCCYFAAAQPLHTHFSGMGPFIW